MGFHHNLSIRRRPYSKQAKDTKSWYLRLFPNQKGLWQWLSPWKGLILRLFWSYAPSCSVVSDSLWPHGLQPARLLCPWSSPGKNTAVGCFFLLQGIFLTQRSNPHLLHCRQILYHLSHLFVYVHLNLCLFTSCHKIPKNIPWLILRRGMLGKKQKRRANASISTWLRETRTKTKETC